MHLSRTRLENLTFKGRWRYLIAGCNPEKYKKFLSFQTKNPHVYDFLESEAREQYAQGWRRSSVWLILNIKRWGPGSTVDTESAYKISNDYFAFYARLLIARNPRYANWIELKAMKGQNFDYGGDSFKGRS